MSQTTHTSHSTRPLLARPATATQVAAAPPRTRRCTDVPHNAWYAVATTDEVGRTPLPRQVHRGSAADGGADWLGVREISGVGVVKALKQAHIA